MTKLKLKQHSSRVKWRPWRSDAGPSFAKVLSGIDLYAPPEVAKEIKDRLEKSK